MKVSILGALGTEIVLFGCASLPPAQNDDDRDYRRQDSYQQLLDDYRVTSRQCRRRGGVMMSTGTFRRGIGGVLSEEQIRTARCIARQ